MASNFGLEEVGRLPQTDEELAVAEPRDVLCSYALNMALYVENLIENPLWETASDPTKASPGFKGWKERRTSKKSSKQLASRIEDSAFYEATSYWGRASLVILRAFVENVRQVNALEEMLGEDGGADGRTPLQDSVAPYRPNRGELGEELVVTNFPTDQDLPELFEQTAVLYDLPFLSHEDGVERMKDLDGSVQAAALGGIVSSPYATRLQIPDINDRTFSELISPQPVHSMLPFVVQVHEHIYSILLGRSIEPGIILDGPIRELGGLGAFHATMISNQAIEFSKVTTPILTFVEKN